MATAAVEPEISDTPTWTVDELGALTGVTVRNIRYYVTLGLLPAPTRHGRMAYFSESHRARIGLIQVMQEQGLSLAAIEQHLVHLPKDASVAEIELRRAVFTSWAPLPKAPADHTELERRAGRRLSQADVEKLERLGTIRTTSQGYETRPTFDVGVGLLDLDIPFDSLEAAGEAIRGHMAALARELREIMRALVLGPMRENNADLDSAEFTRTLRQLSSLTLDAVVANFQEATGALANVGPEAADGDSGA